MEYYAELDEPTGLYCVFDTEGGKAHASYASIEQAEAEAEAREMNDRFDFEYCYDAI